IGPVFTYNFACLLVCALAAWCMYILCYYVTAAYWPSLVGGYVFGFSAYMLGQIVGHMNLALVFPAPLLVLLLIRAFLIYGSPLTLFAGLVLVFVAQFLLFMELFATTTLFLGIAFVVFLAVGSKNDRRQCFRSLPLVALSYVFGIILLSPYFYVMAATGFEP